MSFQREDRWIHKRINVSTDRDATIGRSSECDITINDSNISRKQFHIIVKDGIGQNVFIENMGKTNPAYINETPFDGLVPLKSGDKLRVGTVSFLVDYFCEYRIGW